MPTEEELALRQRRTAWWLGAVRRVRGKTQGDAAKVAGLKAASSLGDFERNVTAPSLKQLALLASFYEVPLRLFTDPPMTDEERILSLAPGAAALEQADWDAEQAGVPGAGDALADARRRAS